MTVRNVRAYQTRGLLPPPEIHGRTAHYGEVHLERLAAIRGLRAEGLSLEEIGRLIERMPKGAAPELLALARALDGRLAAEGPVAVDAETVFSHWGEQSTPDVLDRVERLGHVRSLGDGRYEILSPRLYRAAAEVARLGVPLGAVLGLTEQIWARSEELAGGFVELFAEHIAGPRWATTTPTERLEAIERLRPLAGDSVLAIFELALTRAAVSGATAENSDGGRVVGARGVG